MVWYSAFDSRGRILGRRGDASRTQILAPWGGCPALDLLKKGPKKLHINYFPK